MRRLGARSFTVVALAASIAAATPMPGSTDSGNAPLPLRLVMDVAVHPAGNAFANQTPRMDYESIDPARGMLYVAYLGADEVIAFDLDKHKVHTHIQGLPGVHGTLAVPQLHTLYASATSTDQVAAIDERTLRVVARTGGGDYPDGIAYDPEEHRLFVSDERGGTDTVIDVKTNRTVDTIALGGEVGNSQYDGVSHRVYSDVQSRDEVVAIDPKTDAVVARYPLRGCDHDHGLLLDVARRLAFVACDGNAKLLLMDMRNWKELSVSDVGQQPDVLALDPELGRLYVAAESGVVTVFEVGARSLKTLGMGFLADEAHTVAVDPKTHRAYFALQSVDGTPVIRIMTPIGR